MILLQQSVEVDMERKMKSLLPSGLGSPLMLDFSSIVMSILSSYKSSLLFSVTICVSRECSSLCS